MNFDTVVIKSPDGTQKKMTAEQFAAIAITERVRLVVTGNVIFFLNRQTIPATEAFRRPA
jgi:hypothetical protein